VTEQNPAGDGFLYQFLPKHPHACPSLSGSIGVGQAEQSQPMDSVDAGYVDLVRGELKVAVRGRKVSSAEEEEGGGDIPGLRFDQSRSNQDETESSRWPNT